MMKVKFLFYFFISLFFSCSIFSSYLNNEDSNVLNETNNIKKSDILPLLKMRRTPCFGTCPYFEVSIFSDGSVEYEGFNFVEKIGLYNSKINIKKVALIEDYIRKVDFFSFNELYDARVSDLPSVIIEVNLKGNNHKVRGRYNMPEKFKMLSKFIDNLVSEIEVWDKYEN